MTDTEKINFLIEAGAVVFVWAAVSGLINGGAWLYDRATRSLAWQIHLYRCRRSRRA
ncbi:hypothetical protein LCGC14_2374180, partial [marine sediment metagenome]